MTRTPGVGDVTAGYGELVLVKLPAIALLELLGWAHANLFAETFGEHGSEGRESAHQVILTPADLGERDVSDLSEPQAVTAHERDARWPCHRRNRRHPPLPDAAPGKAALTADPAVRDDSVQYASSLFRASTQDIAMTAAARLDLRLNPADKARISRAADLRGMPLSAFVRDAVLREAETVMAAELSATLSVAESRRFVKALDAPFKPNARLKRAMADAAQLPR